MYKYVIIDINKMLCANYIKQEERKMATQVKYDGYNVKEAAFLISFDNIQVRMNSFCIGLMQIEPLAGNHHIDRLLRKVTGCFEIESNLYGIKSIIIEGNGRSILVNRNNSDPKELLEQLYKF